uniref:Uncharacterized protein n=1 Tax=Arundo donax TaxID=35708 RepID=A0A0A9EGZ9_ARUDO
MTTTKTWNDDNGEQPLFICVRRNLFKFLNAAK